MIFITGDIHGDYDIYKLSSKCFPEGKTLTRSDYVIICGDFGLLWNDSPEEHWWRNWLSQKPWTTLWIDGNHENFDMLKKYPAENWKGGRIQKITENIFHLCRGNVFETDGFRIFAFGGAESHDKQYRIKGRTIWDEELPSPEELETGRKALDTVNWKVDIVITHSLPQHIQEELFGYYEYPCNRLTKYFDDISGKLKFRFWFSGHYHISAGYGDRYYMLYNTIIKLTRNGFETVRSE